MLAKSLDVATAKKVFAIINHVNATTKTEGIVNLINKILEKVVPSLTNYADF